MRVLPFLLPLALAACATLPQPEPQGASLSDSTLTVALSDGTRCTADWRAAGGAGQMEACALPLRYAVTEVADPNILRKFWVELAEALGAEGIAPPMADVVVTGADGRTWRYVSPPPAE